MVCVYESWLIMAWEGWGGVSPWLWIHPQLMENRLVMVRMIVYSGMRLLDSSNIIVTNMPVQSWQKTNSDYIEMPGTMVYLR